MLITNIGIQLSIQQHFFRNISIHLAIFRLAWARAAMRCLSVAPFLLRTYCAVLMQDGTRSRTVHVHERRTVPTLNQALGLVQGLVCSLLLAYWDSIKGHIRVDPANSGDLSGTEQFPLVLTHKSKALVPVRHTGPAMGVGLPHRVAVLLANTVAEFTGTEPELVVEEATGSMETELPSESNRATVGHPGANPLVWGSACINSAQVTQLRAVTCESLALTDLDLWADSENSDCATDSRVSSDITASGTGGGGPSKMLRKGTQAVKSSFRTHEGRGNIRHVQAAARRKARQKWLCDREDLAVRQDIVLRIE